MELQLSFWNTFTIFLLKHFFKKLSSENKCMSFNNTLKFQQVYISIHLPTWPFCCTLKSWNRTNSKLGFQKLHFKMIIWSDIFLNNPGHWKTTILNLKILKHQVWVSIVVRQFVWINVFKMCCTVTLKCRSKFLKV